MAKGECVFWALHNALLDVEISQLKDDFNYGAKTFADTGEPMPPSVHEIIDYFMGMGGALVPIAREPMSEHGSQMFYDFSNDEMYERWENYCDNYNGLLIGRRLNGTAHMAWLERRIVHDHCSGGPFVYPWRECQNNDFYLETLMVLLWQV